MALRSCRALANALPAGVDDRQAYQQWQHARICDARRIRAEADEQRFAKVWNARHAIFHVQAQRHQRRNAEERDEGEQGCG